MMQLNQLSLLLGAGELASEAVFHRVSIDTRTLQPGEVYFAIVGYHLDGHDYIEQAVAAGASAVVVSRMVTADVPVILVKDTTFALGQYAQYRRDHAEIKVLAVTGSVGKTTTRNMVASICRVASSAEEVLCPEKNFNNQWGLPLTLNKLESSHRYAVLELGMRGLGEIAPLTRIARPDVVAITCARENHLERLGTMDNIATAKGEIVAAAPSASTAVLNVDDVYYDYWRSLVKDRALLTFGIESDADVMGAFVGPMCCDIRTPEGAFQCQLPLIGEHNLMNALAATAMALAVGISISAIQQGLETVEPEAGRMVSHTLSNGARLIDDSYNAAPDAMRAAINTLAGEPGKKILMMGDMAELGEHEAEIHQSMGTLASALSIDVLLTLGPLSLQAHRDFAGQAEHFSSHQALLDRLVTLLSKDAVVLVKGSAGMKMTIIVQDLLRKSL